MKRHFLRHISIICFMVLIVAASTSCSAMFMTQAMPTPTIVPTASPTIAPSPTSERLKLINGELDACLLVNPIEVESVLGIKVVTELRFATVGAITCTYTPVSDDQSVFQIVVYTDATLNKVNDTSSAVETYVMQKDVVVNLSTIFKIEDIDNLGDQAYSREGSFLEINVLNNNIYYLFATQTNDGIDYDALMKLVKMAIQRMP